MNKVVLKRELFEMILEGAKRLHPKESIVILRGKVEKECIRISEALIPPSATYGTGFSSFHMHLLPMDFSIIGVTHSHPSGSLKPSVGDLNHQFGRITVIVAPPYRGEESVAAYDREGKRFTVHVA